MPGSRDPEPHRGLAQEAPEIDDPAKRDDVARVLGVQRDRALVADSALELIGGIGVYEHAQRLTAVKTDLDANERAMLSRLAHLAAALYAELEDLWLRNRIAKLERKFKAPAHTILRALARLL